MVDSLHPTDNSQAELLDDVVTSLKSHMHKVLHKCKLRGDGSTSTPDLVLNTNKAVIRCLRTLLCVCVCLYRMLIIHYVFLYKISVERIKSRQ